MICLLYTSYKKLIDNEVDSRYADEIIGEIENSLKKESNIDSILSAVYQKIILKLGKPRAITLSDKAKVVFLSVSYTHLIILTDFYLVNNLYFS